MAFCRFLEGDVYMVPADVGIECICCDLFESEPNTFTTVDDAIEHLLKHCLAGDKAPYNDAINMLRHTTIEMVNEKAVYGTVVSND